MTLLDDMLALLPDNTAGDISAADLRTIVTDLYNNAQPLDADLTAIAGLTATTDSIIQSKGSAWTARTIAQLLVDLALPGTTFQPLDSDLTTLASLTATTDNIIQSKAGAWSSRTLAQFMVDLAALGTTFQPLDADLTAIAGLTPTNDDMIQRKAGAWTNRTLAQVRADLVAASPTVVMPDTTAPSPVANTLIMYSYNLAGQSRLRVMTPEGVPVSVLRDTLAVGRNETGGTLTKMTPVYISGVFTGTENIPIISKAKADSATTVPCVGLLWEDILNNNYGRVMSQGRIDNVDTSGWAVNSVLYLSEVTAGTLTTTRPPHPSFRQPLAFVIRSHASQGSLGVLVGGVGGTGDGTNSNSWAIGDATAGTKSVAFKNTNTLTLQATPTATRTVTIPDATGTIALTASPTFTGTVTQAAVTQTGRTLVTYTVLTDAATIAVDASLGNHFTVTLGGNRTLGNPTNPPGAGQDQMILFAIRQDGTGSRTLALDTNYRFGTDITSITLTTGANKTDYLGVRYNVTDSKWDVIAFVKGY